MVLAVLLFFTRTQEPTPCTMFGLWTDLMERDSASCGWIKAHTKDCPKCKCAPVAACL